MRIFQVIEGSTNISLPSNQTWHRNLYEPLVDLGHDIFLFSADRGRQALSKNDANLRARFSEEMLSTFKREHAIIPFDFGFFYLMDGMFDPAAVSEIKKAGIPLCNFSCNNIHQFELVENISKFFDYNLYSEKAAGEKFKRIGVTGLWWPMASNPKYFHPINVPRSIPCSFVGGRYARRLELIFQLLASGVDVHAYGPGWTSPAEQVSAFRTLLRQAKRTLVGPGNLDFLRRSANNAAAHAESALHRFALGRYPENFHAPVSDEELIALYSRSQVSLGSLEVMENHEFLGRKLKHIHLRDFEAPMSGALYCTDFSSELAEMFEPDIEVLMCRDDYERADKILYYLKNESAGDRVRAAGLKRALADHTYQKRYQTLFSQLGLRLE